MRLRLRTLSASLLLTLAVIGRAARLESADFGAVIGQITKGNRMEQCPCVRPPEGGACISYDSRYQASHVEEAMISFVDMTLPDRERPTDADSLGCTSSECRACFSLLFYRILEIGLLPASYRPAIPVLPRTSISASQCPRLRFPSASQFGAAATAALGAASEAISGLIERGSRFQRSAEAAQAASEAISHLKDKQAHRQPGNHRQRHHQKHHNQAGNRNGQQNNNNQQQQQQVRPASNIGQGRSPQPQQPFRQVQQVQQQLRVQQPSWQQQQQQQQQLQLQQQGINQQQQWAQQSRWNSQQQQFPQQQFPQQQPFNPQQQQFGNAARFMQAARGFDSIAQSIQQGFSRDPLNRWREGYEHDHEHHPRPPPPQQPQDPVTQPPSGPPPDQPDGGYHDHPGDGGGNNGGDWGHHHHPPFFPQGPRGGGQFGGGQPFTGPGNAGLQSGFGGGPQSGAFGGSAGLGLGGAGNAVGGGGFPFGGGGGGGFNHGGFRAARETSQEPQEEPHRKARSVLAPHAGGYLEDEVVSPPVSPFIPRQLRPEPVEVSSFSHDGELVFAEERSAFAELARAKRQLSASKGEEDDGILGSRFTIACFNRGESENGGDDKMLSLCGGCWVWRRLPEGFFPPLVNELVCKKEDRCLSGWGRCVDKTRSVNVLRKVKGQWTAATISTGTCCDCKIVAGSEIHSLIVG